MNNYTKNFSFGRYLKSFRRDKNMTQDDLFQITRISKIILELIENEKHEQLPATVFVKGFLRTYADAVGADGDEAVRLYLLSNKNFKQDLKIVLNSNKPDTKFQPKFLMAILVLFVLISLSIFIMEKGTDKQLTIVEASTELLIDTPVEEPQKQDKSIKEQSPIEPEPLAGIKEKLVDTIPQKLFLKIVCVEETWLKVIIDSHNIMEYTIKSGDELKLEAFYDYNILVGNAAGVKLFLNDKPVKVSGKSGQVVTIKIP